MASKPKVLQQIYIVVRIQGFEAFSGSLVLIPPGVSAFPLAVLLLCGVVPLELSPFRLPLLLRGAAVFERLAVAVFARRGASFGGPIFSFESAGP